MLWCSLLRNVGCGSFFLVLWLGCGSFFLVMTPILWYNCGRTTNLGDFGRKIVLWLGCGVFLEKNWVGVGVVVSYRRKIVLMLLLGCVI